MKKILFSVLISALIITAGCDKDSDFLNVDPTSVVPQDVAFSDPNLVLSILGDLYNRYYDFSGLDGNPTDGAGWRTFADFSESYPSENGSNYIVQRTGWGYGEWGTWDYAYIRDLNLFIERDSAATALLEGDKARFLAEGRFLRASYYFELVKRMGGVPLLTSSVQYDASKGDISSVQFPRAKESDIYDFVISEAEAIKNSLPSDVNVKSRASKGAALAMEARAALYAASIAKYGATTPSVKLAGGEVGIDATKANGYYTIALRAAKEIISGQAGSYALYNRGGDLADSYANLFLDKNSAETIFFEDFKTGGKVHGFTTNDQPYSLSEEGGDAGRLDPSLNLAEQYEKLDNTYAPFTTTDAAGNPVFYSSQADIFANRDARLAGTILLPSGTFKGGLLDIWAGYVLADGSVITSTESGVLKTLPGQSTAVQVVGEDGPVNGLEFRTQSGFYIRKYLDPTTGSGRRGQGSTVAFIRYRYAEVLLNAAEASFELGDNTTAALYMNQVRARAGLTVPLTAGDITFDRIVHERRVELAFEGHILFDYKRWRIAHKVWDGNPTTLSDLKNNIGKATQRSTQPWGLWPYKYYNPGNANNGKWLFREVLPALATGFNRFLFGNYYSQISSGIIGANPKIIAQPNQ